MGGTIDNFYFSTWTMNKTNSDKIIELYDNGVIKNKNALVGLYFKKKEASVFNEFYEKIKERKQNLFSNENHSKVTLLDNEKDYIVIQGSANFTANPRIEQFTIHNNKYLYYFHKKWMDEIFSK